MLLMKQYHLCRGLGVSTRQSRLHQDLALFHHIDLAICREGVDSLSIPELQQVFLSLCSMQLWLWFLTVVIILTKN